MEIFAFAGSALSGNQQLGLAPVVGIPLPLLSYGGSAMMTVLILLGILMSFDRAERKSGASATLSLSLLGHF